MPQDIQDPETDRPLTYCAQIFIDLLEQQAIDHGDKAKRKLSSICPSIFLKKVQWLVFCYTQPIVTTHQCSTWTNSACSTTLVIRKVIQVDGPSSLSNTTGMPNLSQTDNVDWTEAALRS